MATSFDEVIDLALVNVEDYKFLKAYKQGEEVFNKWCDGFLLSAIPNFTQCRQKLDYDIEKREFIADLTVTEISILADLWVIAWFKKETNDSTKINALLQPNSGGFKTHAASQNLKEKGAYLDALREKVSQKIVDYQLQDINALNI